MVGWDLATAATRWLEIEGVVDRERTKMVAT